MFSLKSTQDIPEDIPPHLKAPFQILDSKQGIPTAKEDGKFLHSLYNPLREAEQGAKNAKVSLADSYGCAFFSAGLGYSVISYAELFPNDTIIIVEPDPRYFFTALSLVDWSKVFAVKNCIIALATGIDSVVALIERAGGFKHISIMENSAQSAHAADFFSALHSLIQRNRKKEEINASTLEKFSSLWLRNTCMNRDKLLQCDGISIFKDSCPPDLPLVLLAAGPTLSEILPHLKEIKKRAILVAVDTALRACLHSGVEPDFIVLADPQYYAYRHIAGLSSPSSILITESAAYPAVYRFNCKKIILCASLFPLGQYIESKIGSKGKLVAGGSVSTTAWDFARYIGAHEIFCAGLDLGYPQFQTHIKGSTFEENIHTKSFRLSPSEKSGSGILFGADMLTEKDYRGETILTDSKMKMFAWWFESKCEEFKESLKTYTLSAKSLKIPGFSVSSPELLLKMPEHLSQKKEFFRHGEKMSKSIELEKESLKNAYKSAIEELLLGLSQLYDTAKKGLRLADDGIKSNNPQKYLAMLAEIDKNILNSKYKEIASLVFPTERRLSNLIENLPPLNNEVKSSLQKSKLIYKELMTSISKYKKFF